MKSIKLLTLFLILFGMLAACGGGGSNNNNGVNPNATLTSISVTPVNSAVPVGGTQQFTATGTYSDSSTRNITSSVTWSSSNTSVATVTSSGIVSGVAIGNATISANMSGTDISGYTSVSVAPNIMTVTVNGSLCNSANSKGYINKPCVSVTICPPGNGSCTTVNDILLDTASYGLRIFSQTLNGASLTPVTVGNAPLAECVTYGDGTSTWGPVQMASVILGSEPQVTLPVQVIDSTYQSSNRPSACQTSLSTPSQAGYNGILGIGLFAQDCGSACTSSSSAGWYYICSGAGKCTGIAVPLASQVQNPVPMFPIDNNGLIVSLPSVGSSGASSVTGEVIFGIGTRDNNIPPGQVVAYPTSSDGGTILTSTPFWGGATSKQSFLDTGSNALSFYHPSLTKNSSGWYTPGSLTSLTAVNMGYNGSPSGQVSFQIGNFNTLTNSNNNVFSNIGAYTPLNAGFDWGLPFFLGRDVYVGVEGKSSTLGTGPYLAY